MREDKWAIVFHRLACRNITKVAGQLGHSKKPARHWVNQYSQHGNVDTAKKTRRPPSLDSKRAMAAADLLVGDDHGTPTDVARVLHAQGSTTKLLHKSTVIRLAKAAAAAKGKPIRVLRGFPSKTLCKGTTTKRLHFATHNKGHSWNNVMFTDRKKFYFYYPGVSVKPLKWFRNGETW